MVKKGCTGHYVRIFFLCENSNVKYFKKNIFAVDYKTATHRTPYSIKKDGTLLGRHVTNKSRSTGSEVAMFPYGCAVRVGPIMPCLSHNRKHLAIIISLSSISCLCAIRGLEQRLQYKYTYVLRSHGAS
jgi:hypothetical protein